MPIRVMDAAVLPVLTPATLARLPAAVARPGYDRAALPVRVAHVGVGAFHRAHQAEYLDDLIAGGHWRGAEVGLNLRQPVLGETLGPQGGLYSRTLAEGDRTGVRVLGAITAWADGAGGAAWLADPAVTVVTLTVTEKGYCHIPATGALDEGHPGVLADLAGGEPVTVPGFLLRGLAARRAAGAGPLALVSCDNIAGNGQVLRAVVRGMAGAMRPDLMGWIDDHVTFPSTMVDRIVPATTPDDVVTAAARLGLRDACPVRCEAFRQWVIEDDFRSDRPPWEAAGAEIVADMAAHEAVKMRVLNAAQTMLALLGALRGHAFTHEAVADAGLRAFIEATLRDETLPHLPQAAGMAPVPYLAQAMVRIGNRAIHHRCHQIATDTSQKIRQRILDPLRARRAAGLAAPGLETGLAAWLAYLRAGRWDVADPVAAEVEGVMRRAGGGMGPFVAGVMGLRAIFGDDLGRDSALVGRVAGKVALLLAQGEGGGPVPV
ncbi:MAG: mannitol dehydrogenase family protein [Gemmobacter sp.]